MRKAFISPTSDKAWLIKVLIGGLISTIPMGVIVAYGYLMIHLHSLLKEENKNLPQWRSINIILQISMKMIVVYMIYGLPLIATQLIINRYYSIDTTMFFTSIKTSMIISLPIMLVIKYFLNVAYVNFARNDFKLSTAFNMGEIFNLLRTHIRRYNLVYMWDIFVILILFLDIIIFIDKHWIFIFIQFLIGSFIFYAYLVINNMLAFIFRGQ